MFEEIKEKHKKYSEQLEKAYKQSDALDLSPDILKYRHLSKQDFDKIFAIVDAVQPMLNYDHMAGACIFVHSYLKKALANYGYASELIFGDVIVNAEAHMKCNLEDLKKQLDKGISPETQKVHCWLLLENYQVFDATLFRDLSGGIYAAELYGYGYTTLDGNTFQYEPMLAGFKFVEKTNPSPSIVL
ncbi:hypothetical protein MACH09_10320 [Vibrio sp. MACH09]|uniref:hypothetical protein n=1 Tax=Vibrio sp. MACH09 TaxID=3025122 RepID=UPI00278CAAFB|nr:hypothetical protein [Vibrio sp. MACH09]GLO60524.1 hypothetical protein MACH09_10320 [Vibrio sp. MACH09]